MESREAVNIPQETRAERVHRIVQNFFDTYVADAERQQIEDGDLPW